MTREEAIEIFKSMSEVKSQLNAYGVDNEYGFRVGNKFFDAIDMAIRTLEQTRWIPVSESLPEKDGRYLTYIVNPYEKDLKYIMVCDFSASAWGPWYPDDPTASDDVVAWMSLPEPPIRGGKGGRMSEANGKVCCNCRHNIRFQTTAYKTPFIACMCEIHNKYLSYEQVMCGWCRHWAKEKHKAESEAEHERS